MRALIAVIVGLALVALAAVATRPTEQDFHAMIEAAIRERIATADVDGSGDAVGTIALVGCKLRPSDCISLVREAMDVRLMRGLFTTSVEFDGLGRSGTCIGAFRRFWCNMREDRS